MRNKHYKLKGYRLDDITMERLKKIKLESWNITFTKLLDLHKKYGFLEPDKDYKK